MWPFHEQTIASRYFSKHLVSRSGDTGLVFREPNTGFGWMKFIIDKETRSLIVLGDYDNAIYQFPGSSPEFNWEFLAGLDLGYFAKKCVAGQARQWYVEKTRQWLYEVRNSFPLGRIDGKDLWDTLLDAECPEEWVDALKDSEDISEYYNVGYDISLLVQIHFVGLQIALRELLSNKNSEDSPVEVS